MGIELPVIYMIKKEILSDLFLAIKYGILCTVVCSALFLLGGFFFCGFSLYGAVSIWRSGMCIISGFSLFIVAGMILMKKHKEVNPDSQWRKKFHKLNYGGVIGMIAIIFILCAACSDAILFYLTAH